MAQRSAGSGSVGAAGSASARWIDCPRGARARFQGRDRTTERAARLCALCDTDTASPFRERSQIARRADACRDRWRNLRRRKFLDFWHALSDILRRPKQLGCL
jgi:hypothetical protein